MEPRRCPAAREGALADCEVPNIDADMVEAMFVSSLRLLLLERDEEHGGAAKSVGHRELRDAALADDEERVEAALERMFAEAQPQLRASTLSRRRARELDAVSRFELWAEQEREGRTAESRTQALELGRVLRGWFTSIAVTVDESTIRFVARRRVTRGGRMSARSEAQVDLGDWARLAPLARRATARYGEWTRPELIGALQAWADEHGRSPRWSDLDKHREDCPSPQTVQRHFGSWEGALSAAGLQAQPRLVGRHRVWSKQEVVAALVQWAEEHDRPPASGDWRRGAPERPCSKTVCVHFGSWKAALAAAGLTDEHESAERHNRAPTRSLASPDNASCDG